MDTDFQNLLRKMWLRCLVGALLAVVIAKPLADWAYTRFDFLRYHPTVTVDPSARVVTHLGMPAASEVGASAPFGNSR